jgi:hypothetical protein
VNGENSTTLCTISPPEKAYLTHISARICRISDCGK